LNVLDVTVNSGASAADAPIATIKATDPAPIALRRNLFIDMFAPEVGCDPARRSGHRRTATRAPEHTPRDPRAAAWPRHRPAPHAPPRARCARAGDGRTGAE